MSDTPGDVRGQVRAYIEENFLYLRPDLELKDGDELMALGLLDSLGFVELVEEVQSRFGLEIQDVDITEENFGSIDAIVRYVESKGAAAA
jgi:acyl carrier protein